MLRANAFINTQQRVCHAQHKGYTLPDSDVEDAPSVVRVGVTPDTAGPDDDVEFGV